MLQLRLALNAVKGMDVEISTQYSSVSGILVEVKSTYLVLRSNSDLVYIPLGSINGVSY